MSHNFKYTRVGEPRSITNQQPKPSSEIYPMDSPNYNEKFSSTSTHNDCECESQRPNGTSGHHGSCHNSRLRRLLIPALIAFIVLGGLMTLGCTMGGYNPGSWGSDLVSRALGDGTTGSGNGTNGGTFVHNKLYLIVVFVGLVLVVILGICLSAWCCKGSFQNPLCCPCYLCACCGGLACLECIGCGLCAEGLDQM